MTRKTTKKTKPEETTPQETVKTQTVPIKILGREKVESDNEWFENWPQSESPDYDLEIAEKAYIDSLAEYVKTKRKMEQAKDELWKAYQKKGITSMPWENLGD